MHDYLVTQTNTTFLELTTAQSILSENGRVTGVTLKPQTGEAYTVYAPHVVVAPGRGGADWLQGVARSLGLSTRNNEVDIGVRIEVPNCIMDHLTKHLYEAKLVY